MHTYTHSQCSSTSIVVSMSLVPVPTLLVVVLLIAKVIAVIFAGAIAVIAGLKASYGIFPISVLEG